MAAPSIRTLRWAYHRLRAMTPAEVVWRTRQAVDAVRARTRHRLQSGRRPDLADVGDTELEGRSLLFGFASAHRPFLPAEDRERRSLRASLATLPPPALLRRSAATHFTPLLGTDVELTPGLDWNRDPLTGRTFPLQHWSAIDHREPAEEAAIRRIWYLNRHLMLPDMALDYYLTGDEGAAERVCELLDGWIAQCPAESGVNWMIPLEIGFRLWSWSWVARLLAGSPALEHTARRLAVSVHLQAEHVRRHLSAYSSANNHLLAQGLGLLAAGTAFSGLYGSRGWREAGRHILLTELTRQTHADGVSREQSRHYHELVLEIYLTTWLLLARCVGPLPARARERLERMLEFLADLDSMPPGTSDIGDSDDQSALPFAGGERPARTLLAIGAVLFGRGDWKAQCGELPRAAAVLLGADDRAKFAALEPVRTEAASHFYRAGGYALLRDGGGERALLFDCGPLGFLRTAAHGHADCLSVTLTAFGEAMLIDPGTYTYHAEPRWRDFFRSTAAHNTVRIDGSNQSEMLGPFLWGQKAAARPTTWSTTPAVDLAGGSHAGYRGLPGSVKHRRRVLFVKPDYIWLDDRIEGSGEHEIEQFFHFPPCSIRLGDGEPGGQPGSVVGREIIASYPSGAVLRLDAAGEGLPEVDILVGIDDPAQGWRSPRFGVKEPAPTLRFRGRRELPLNLATLLRPLPTRPRAGQQAAASARSLGERFRALLVTGMPGTDLCLLHDGPGEVAGRLEGREGLGGEVRLAGEMALVRWNGDGNPAGLPVTIAGTGLERLVVGGRPIVEVEGDRLTFSFRRLGDQAVWTGNGNGRVRIWAPGLAAVRRRGRLMPISRDDDDAVVLELGDGN